ncbi:hypothetical protein PINS_up013489 [Pythium insidiosum]|nr:hypothetical protein PINS_up013489 [Pythium insidiosum]
MTVNGANAPSSAAATAEATDASSPSSRRAAANVWASTFFDTLTKYERNSERQLYIYGITTLRCVGCRHRLKAGAASCDNCQQAVDDKTKSCTRCSVRTPAMWCHECDAYFCEPCHNKPHVLVLGGKNPPRHHCFPIDTCSGKTLRRGAWSAKFLAKCKAVRREQWRLHKEKDAAAKHAAATTESTGAPENHTAPAASTAQSAVAVRPEHSSKENGEHETAKRVSSTVVSPAEATPNPPPKPPGGATNATASALRSATPRPVVSSSARQLTTAQPSATTAPVLSQTATPNTSSASVSKPMAPTPSTKVPIPSAPIPTAPPTVPPSAAVPTPPVWMPASRSDAAVQGPAASSRPTTATTSPASRKRKAPATETAPPAPPRSMPPPRQQPMTTTVPTASAPPPAATASTSAPITHALAPPRPTSGGSLYDRLRQMHDLQRRQQAAAQAVRVKPEPTVSTTVAPPASSASTPVSVPSESIVTGSTTTSTPAVGATVVTAKAETLRQEPPLAPAPAPAPASASPPEHNAASSTGDSDLDHALSQTIDPLPVPVVDLTTRPPTPPTGTAAATAGAGAGADDPLKVAVIEEYEKTNEYVLKVEAQIAYISDAVRRASMQNVAMAAQISDRVNAYRRMLAEATERRCRALAKVVLFSPDVRASARQMDRDELADLPPVVTACHNKCAQLAIAVKQLKERVQELRAAIDSAIASGDVMQIAQLQTLGTQIQEVEGQIRQAKSDRDTQFNLMVRFSKKVRDMVQLEAQALKP